jgi:hypothetical protein
VHRGCTRSPPKGHDPPGPHRRALMPWCPTKVPTARTSRRKKRGAAGHHLLPASARAPRRVEPQSAPWITYPTGRSKRPLGRFRAYRGGGARLPCMPWHRYSIRRCGQGRNADSIWRSERAGLMASSIGSVRGKGALAQRAPFHLHQNARAFRHRNPIDTPDRSSPINLSTFRPLPRDRQPITSQITLAKWS